ncbi:cupin domain-containing protein [Microbulbifer sp. MLAF003]|uniref:cupin domain-containing protein n=1 Tax=Microbulbifer TaxID=48073 RepID=UPI0003A323CE|nr:MULTISPECIES: cupin domain-containing protein [Microbulbifer]WHI51735.1 cupin domain-containing protein [Microbulbifer sp. MLAF003]
MKNIFAHLPADTSVEHFTDIVKSGDMRIERIVSYGQSSPEQGWYNQEQNEWVIVLSGYGLIEFNCGEKVRLEAGDFVEITAGRKHRVLETSSEEATVWLAVFYT